MGTQASGPRITLSYRSLEWIGGVDGHLRLLDQTRLPEAVDYLDCRSAEEVWDAIRRLCVRGAPAIGVAAAYGAVLGCSRREPLRWEDVEQICAYLKTCRPTAVNLGWALDRMLRTAQRCLTEGSGTSGRMALPASLLREAQAIEQEDRETCQALGRNGAELIPDGGAVLTHCNTGALAAAGIGTALAALFAAWEQGKRFTVWVDETRPLLQGARLTAWELHQRGIPAAVLCDHAAGQLMGAGKVQVVIVGADRIAANGDVANKIGTYGLAVLARAHGIPMYVSAPASTFDLSITGGWEIPIEQRSAEEVSVGLGRRTVPEGVEVYNPAFDVTPAEWISGIVTERGIIAPVNEARIRERLTT
jgi:methylthioribose-1-phosphate isomerase